VRVGAWVKTFCAFKRGVRPAYAWEPVIYRGGHNPPWEPHPPPLKGGKQTTPKDFIACPITLKKGLTGAKPAQFCDWVLDLLNVKDGDVVDDLFPGTGIMTERTWWRLHGAA
jgi:DNA modification methylase